MVLGGKPSTRKVWRVVFDAWTADGPRDALARLVERRLMAMQAESFSGFPLASFRLAEPGRRQDGVLN